MPGVKPQLFSVSLHTQHHDATYPLSSSETPNKGHQNGRTFNILQQYKDAYAITKYFKKMSHFHQKKSLSLQEANSLYATNRRALQQLKKYRPTGLSEKIDFLVARILYGNSIKSAENALHKAEIIENTAELFRGQLPGISFEESRSLAESTFRQIDRNLDTWMQKVKSRNPLKIIRGKSIQKNVFVKLPIMIAGSKEQAPFSAKCMMTTDGLYKVILSTKNEVGRGTMNVVTGTVEIELSQNKRLRVAKGVKRKTNNTELMTDTEAKKIRERVTNIRLLLKDVPAIQIPNPIILKQDRETGKYKAISYDIHLGYPVCNEEGSVFQIDETEAKTLLTNFAESLLHMRKGNDPQKILLHGDLKPYNILVKRDAQEQISSGIIIDTDGVAQGKDPDVHTPAYARLYTSEALSGAEVDLNQDVFSLALTIAELIDPVKAEVLLDKLYELHTDGAGSYFGEKQKILNETIEECQFPQPHSDYLKIAANLKPDDVQGGTKLLQEMLQYAKAVE